MLDLKVAKVYVDKTSFHFDKAFDYVVPSEFSDSVKRGCRVIIPFGNGNRKRQGMVYDVFSVDEIYAKLKPIAFVLDEKPIFTEEMFKMAEFMVKNTFCAFYEAVKAIVPTGININFFENYKMNVDIDLIDESELDEHEKNLLEFLKKAKNPKEINEILLYNQNSKKKKTVESLIKKGIVVKTENFKQKAVEKTITIFKLSDEFLNLESKFRLTKKQTEVVDFVKTVTNATKKEITYFCGTSDGVINTLHKKNVLHSFSVVVEEEIQEQNNQIDDLVLNEEQTKVYNDIIDIIDKKAPAVGLLHGITGSGKTQVFIKLIENCINNGKQALMLVPEIALTPQIVNKFKLLFPNQVAVIHSNLSLSERVREYNKIKENKVKIVVGTRSAIFAPFDKIGIIIMDEEGEYSYKSDANPRYHAREIAKLRCVHHKAFLLLASATPSIESYFKASKNVYTLHELENRYSGTNLPEVFLIDMKSEMMNGNSSAISTMLKEEIEKNLQRQEQCIILINRRGYNTVMECADCGEIVKCKHCDVALTYHKANGYMMCHYCGYSVPIKTKCEHCNSSHLKMLGFGTQKIQDDLQNLFPQAKILRMDTDTTGSKFAYEEKFEAFAKHEYDILVGTQMIAKGLDFEKVTLVGVLNIDNGLYSSDYKAVERVFSLITQVVGRSGRATQQGRAYIQTQVPDNLVINYAAKQDYKSFYNDEIFSRKALKYPPFCDICVISISALKERTAKIGAEEFIKIMQQNVDATNKSLNFSVLGPIEANVYKLNNKYREKIIIKCKLNNAFREYLKNVMLLTSKNPRTKNITVSIDINGDVSF